MATITVKTVGSTGADYATLTLWQTGQIKDLVAADVIEKAELQNEDHAPLFFNAGWTTDATRYVWITAQAGAEHDGTAGSGAAIHLQNSDPIAQGLNLGSAGDNFHIHVTNIRIRSTETASNNSAILLRNACNLTCDRIIIHNFEHTNDRGINFSNRTDPVCTITNSLIYAIALSAINVEGTTSQVQTLNIYNCTVHGGTSAIRIDANSAPSGDLKDVDCRNCLLHGITNAIGYDFGNVWNAATDQNVLNDASGTAASMPGTLRESFTFQAGTGGAGDRVMFQNLTPGTENFHLAVPATLSDNGAIDFGNNLTGLGGLLHGQDVTFDLDRILRPSTGAWDAGSDELIFAIEGLPPAYGGTPAVGTLPPAYGVSGSGTLPPAYPPVP